MCESPRRAAVSEMLGLRLVWTITPGLNFLTSRTFSAGLMLGRAVNELPDPGVHVIGCLDVRAV